MSEKVSATFHAISQSSDPRWRRSRPDPHSHAGSRDGERLPVRLGLEGRRANVRDPDLDRPQALPAQPFTACPLFIFP